MQGEFAGEPLIQTFERKTVTSLICGKDRKVEKPTFRQVELISKFINYNTNTETTRIFKKKD